MLCVTVSSAVSALPGVWELRELVRDPSSGYLSIQSSLTLSLTDKQCQLASISQVCVISQACVCVCVCVAVVTRSITSLPVSSDDHRVLVPPACGAALAGLYSPSVLKDVRASGMLPHPLRHVVAIVCGGNGVNLETIQQWKKTYDL